MILIIFIIFIYIFDQQTAASQSVRESSVAISIKTFKMHNIYHMCCEKTTALQLHLKQKWAIFIPYESCWSNPFIQYNMNVITLMYNWYLCILFMRMRVNGCTMITGYFGFLALTKIDQFWLVWMFMCFKNQPSAIKCLYHRREGNIQLIGPLLKNSIKGITKWNYNNIQ